MKHTSGTRLVKSFDKGCWRGLWLAVMKHSTTNQRQGKGVAKGYGRRLWSNGLTEEGMRDLEKKSEQAPSEAHERHSGKRIARWSETKKVLRDGAKRGDMVERPYGEAHEDESWHGEGLSGIAARKSEEVSKAQVKAIRSVESRCDPVFRLECPGFVKRKIGSGGAAEMSRDKRKPKPRKSVFSFRSWLRKNVLRSFVGLDDAEPMAKEAGSRDELQDGQGRSVMGSGFSFQLCDGS